MKKESFEGHVERVKGLLERLSAPEVSLEESLKLYKEGMEHIKEAQKMLQEAKLSYEEVRLNVADMPKEES